MTVTFSPPPGPPNVQTFSGVWTYIAKLYQVILGVLRGKLNCKTTVTLTASATTTTLTHELIGTESVILFMPTTANAATAAANLYVSARAQGSATLTHSSSANVDQSFSVVIIG